MTRLDQDPGAEAETVFRSGGGRLVSAEGEELPLRAVEVSAKAAGGLARTELRQVYRNNHEEPLQLTYKFPLPADGTVSGFEIRIGDRVIHGEIDRRLTAHERFERALVEGQSAALLDQERANLFTQHLGNVPPGAEITIVLTVDQPLAWLADGAWEWRFPTVAAPRYLGEEGRVPDAEAVTLDVGSRPTGIKVALDLTIGDEITQGEPTSPSHAIRTERSCVSLDGVGSALDRDIVVRWTVACPQPGLNLRLARPGDGTPHSGSAYALLTLAPPLVPEVTLARDLIVLLDVSGSMIGGPIGRAKQLVIRLIESLSAIDRLEMVAFAHRPLRWQPHPVEAFLEERRSAVGWVETLSAGGGTEMISAIREALDPVSADAQRQVILVTDGLVGFESDAVRAIRDRLPRNSRLHTIGVGSATNTAFLHSAARAGRGVEVIVGLDDELHKSAARIVAATQGPVVVDVEISGSAVEQCAPRKTSDLMAASPVRQGIRLRPEGGELKVRGRTPEGEWEQRLDVSPTPLGAGDPAVIALYGREAVEDLELDAACGDGRNRRDGIDHQIETVGLEFGLATRLTSWIAVSEEPTVDPRKPVRVERVPQELPYGMSAEALGLRRAATCLETTMQPGEMDQLMGLTGSVELHALRSTGLKWASRVHAMKPTRSLRPDGGGRIVVGSIDALIQLFGQLIERQALDKDGVIVDLGKVHRALLELRRTIDGEDVDGEAMATAIQCVRGAMQFSMLDTATNDELCDLRDRLIPSISAMLDQIDQDRLFAFGRQPCMTLRGRVLSARIRKVWIVEFSMPQLLDWHPPGFAIVRKGSEVQLAMIGMRKTTRAGQIRKGRRVRLELEVAQDAMVGVEEVGIYSETAILMIQLEKRV